MHSREFSWKVRRRIALPHHELFSGCSLRPSCHMRPKESETVQNEEILPFPINCTNNTPKVRFSAMLGQEEPEVEVALL